MKVMNPVYQNRSILMFVQGVVCEESMQSFTNIDVSLATRGKAYGST